MKYKRSELQLLLSNKEREVMNKKINYLLGLVSGAALMVIVWAVFLSDVGGGGNTLRHGNLLSTQSAGFTADDGAATALDFNDVTEKLYHIYRIIDSQFIGEFDLDLAIEMMFAGFVDAAGDPYTLYMDAAAFTMFQENTEGSFVGIGVSIVMDEASNRIMVISPFEGSPAHEAGILSGDKIIRINGQEVFGDGMREAINMMRGEVGTEVVVTVLRDSDNSIHDFPIIRDTIQIETVRGHVIEDEGARIGYIRISQFDRVTFEQFTRVYDRMLQEGIDGLILDVRNNPGGLLSVVNQITNLLVPEGIITYTENVRGERNYVRADARHIEVPLIVLVNGNSASASEVLSGAVRDSGIGEIVGTTTFGKGLVQNVFDMPDGSAVKVTIARFFTPAGICINGEGIVPNYYVEMDSELTNRLSRLAQEDDVQLLEAIRIMHNRIAQ